MRPSESAAKSTRFVTCSWWQVMMPCSDVLPEGRADALCTNSMRFRVALTRDAAARALPGREHRLAQRTNRLCQQGALCKLSRPSVSVFSRMKVMQKRTRETDKNTTLPRTKTTRYITAHILHVGLGVGGRVFLSHSGRACARIYLEYKILLEILFHLFRCPPPPTITHAAPRAQPTRCRMRCSSARQHSLARRQPGSPASGTCTLPLSGLLERRRYLRPAAARQGRRRRAV